MKKLTLNDWTSVLSKWNKIIAFIACDKSVCVKGLGCTLHKHVFNDTHIDIFSISYGSDNCRFCNLFSNCRGCPVSIETGFAGCGFTPWGNLHCSTSEKEWLRHSVRERDFLLSIAPKEYLKQLNFISNFRY